ncbi:hypothetical protein MHU86_25500 [Fragilaria crotonensis]|nr:hypothetical protein MHU86_25500 [Fragilaria crotonensis]
MENCNSADDVDDVAKDSSRAGGIQEHDFAEEFSSDLPSTAMPSSAPSGSSSYASLSSPSAAKVDDRDVAHGAGRVGDTKKLEHALPTDPRMQLPAAGFGMVDSYRDVAHGAGRVGDTKKLEHALPTDPRMQLPAAGLEW